MNNYLFYRYSISLLLLVAVAICLLQIASPLSLSAQWQLVTEMQIQDVDQVLYLYGYLPRIVMAFMVGGALALVGSLLQQLTQNYLLSPMTLGLSSGAWLALVSLSIWAPSLVATHGHWFAMLGATLSTLLVMLIAGRQGLGGLPVVLAGMAINILLASIANALLLTHDQYAKNLFIWGAGDLSQNDWSNVLNLAPVMLIVPILLLLSPRILTLLKIGEGIASGRGLNLLPVMIGLLSLSIYLVAHAVTLVGVLGFVGLIAPNIARYLGARKALDQLCYSFLMGALVLMGADMIALYAGQLMQVLVPTGTTVAILGAPLLIYLSRKKFTANDQQSLSIPLGIKQLSPFIWLSLLLLTGLLLLISLTLSPSLQGWQFTIPDALTWSFRWPRVFTSLFAGAAMALSGMILQRLIANPLASPDILGISAGATFALVSVTLITGISIFEVGALTAFIGSMITLAILILLSKKQRFAPSVVIMIGISLGALIDALVAFSLISGSDDIYPVLGWLSGSTYRVSSEKTWLLIILFCVLFTACLALQRSLTLLSAGDDIAQARGLATNKARLILLSLAALLCASVTAVLGPLAFIGLLAPHMAVMLGARKVVNQLVLCCLIGGALMVLADWLGRVTFYPMQLPAGTVASVLGGSYFVFLLLKGRLSN